MLQQLIYQVSIKNLSVKMRRLYLITSLLPNLAASLFFQTNGKTVSARTNQLKVFKKQIETFYQR